VYSYYLINYVGMLEQAMAAVQECHSAETAISEPLNNHFIVKKKITIMAV